VALCGLISGYNAADPPPGPRAFGNLLIQRAMVQGFIVLDHFEGAPEADEEAIDEEGIDEVAINPMIELRANGAFLRARELFSLRISAAVWHMESIGVRELRQNASRYLAKVASSGEPIEITEHGRPIARLVPITDDPWADMIANGEITPAGGGGDVRNIEPIAADFDASRSLAELRAQER
jgi:prevent-host-death family protein